ncbi:DUF2244 domain-containing protein [Mesorhizobium sp. XAP10]|nr:MULTISPECIES: DUF2244 domain-containing protein [unclassified Mesorhizobium]MDF3155285.1 DUF2244 domain-containing protein [Mesorhizobium sp. XAP10]MDF3248166.1 DUF2244 domain-containing protein [Mesorhizobium sp. XAP4]
MSDTNASFQADEPFFQALLTPHRSLGRTGFFVLMGALLFGWLVTGAFFLSRGAWPVFGFFGLDVAAVYIAFRINYCHRLFARAGDRQDTLRQPRAIPGLESGAYLGMRRKKASFGWRSTPRGAIFRLKETVP